MLSGRNTEPRQGCDQRAKRSREELPHVRGQGQKPGGPHALEEVAKRNYPTFEVRSGSWEELPDVRGQELLHLQGAVAARAQKGLEELFHVQGQEGRW